MTTYRTLLEASRKELIDKSKGADIVKKYGTTRYDRKGMQHIYNSVEAFNKIDCNALFRANLLSFVIPVHGETDNYGVEVLFEGICDGIKREVVANNDELEFKCVYRALIDAINKKDILIACTCLNKDTKISLLDGSTPTVAEMKSRFDSGEQLWVYSTDEKGDFKPGKVTDVIITKHTKDFIKVTLDNGESILTTPDHLYMLRDGNYKEAKDLVIGQSLMPLYFNTSNKYLQIKLNSEIKGWRSVYKLVAEELYKDLIEEKNNQAIKDREAGLDHTEKNLNVAIHHIDFNKSNNNPENLKVMTAYEHCMYHANTINRLWEDENFRKANSIRASEHMKYLNAHPSDKMIENTKLFLEKGHEYWRTEEGRAKKSAEMKANMANFWDNISQEEYDAIKAKSSNTHKEHKIQNKINKIGRLLEKIINDNKIATPEIYLEYKRRFDPKWQDVFNSWEEVIAYYNINHKIINIEHITLDTEEPVYDITVEKWHNFLTTAGVVLHNCADWKYRFAYWASRGGYNGGRPEIRAADITNPHDSKGCGCKHVMSVLDNLDWAVKLATSIYNYIIYMQENDEDKYARLIHPVIHKKPYEPEPDVEQGDDELANTIDHDEDQEVIDKANAGRPEQEVPEDEADYEDF